MSLAVLKKKTKAKENLSGRGPIQIFNSLGPFGKNDKYYSESVGFSLVGGYRNIGGVGNTNLAKSVTRTRFKGNIPIGNGGCCGNYTVNISNSGSCSNNNNNIIKRSVLGNKGMITTKYKWINSKNIFKQDDNNSLNKSQNVYIDKIIKSNICFLSNEKSNTILPCKKTKCYYFIGGKKYIYLGYTKFIKQAVDASQYTLHISNKCLK